MLRAQQPAVDLRLTGSRALMLLATATICATPRFASAEEEACGGRRAHRPVQDLFASDVVYLQERGETQLEVRPARETSDDGRTTTLSLVAEHGLTDWLQLELEWDAREWTRTPSGDQSSGRGDLAFGTRAGWRCIGGSPYHLSIGADLEVPAGSEGDAGNAGRRLRAAPFVILGRNVGDTAQLFTALSMSTPLTQRADQPAAVYRSDTGGFIRLVHGFRATTEIAVEGGRERGTDVQWIPGVLWHRRDTLEVGVGVLTALTPDAPHGVVGHVVLEFGGDH